MKNMNTNKLMSLIIIVAFFVSCKSFTDHSESNLVAGGNTSPQKESIDEFIGEGSGVYASAFFESDFNININAHKYTPLYDEQFASYYTTSNSLVKAVHLTSLPVYISVDGILAFGENLATKAASPDINNRALFGKNIQIGFNRTSITKSAIADTSMEMYIPQLVTITSPAIEDESKLHPHCYYKNFILKWNADKDNKNGLIISMSWNGTVLCGQADEERTIRRTYWIANDTGETVLDESLFDDVPDTGLVHLTLLRGNIQHINLDDVSYKLSAQTNITLPVVIIRELTTT